MIDRCYMMMKRQEREGKNPKPGASYGKLDSYQIALQAIEAEREISRRIGRRRRRTLFRPYSGGCNQEWEDIFVHDKISVGERERDTDRQRTKGVKQKGTQNEQKESGKEREEAKEGRKPRNPATRPRRKTSSVYLQKARWAGGRVGRGSSRQGGQTTRAQEQKGGDISVFMANLATCSLNRSQPRFHRASKPMRMP